MHKINLQLFANANTNVTTASGMSPEMRTFYEKQLIKTAEPDLIFDQFGQKAPIPKNGGKTIQFRKYSQLAKQLTPLTEGVTPDGQTMTVSQITATIAQYGGYVTLSDVLELTAIDNNIVQATNIMASQAGRTLDTITRDVVCGGTNVFYAPKIVSGAKTAVTTRAGMDATSALDVDSIMRAVAFLKAQNAKKIGDSYIGIVHPYAAYDLKKDPEFVEWNKYTTPEKMWNGEIGKIGDVRFVENSEAKIFNDGTATTPTCPSYLDGATTKYMSVFMTMILGADAYGVTEVEGGGLQHIVKPLGAGEDPLNQRSTVGWKALKVAERLIEPYMVRIESTGAYAKTATAN